MRGRGGLTICLALTSVSGAGGPHPVGCADAAPPPRDTYMVIGSLSLKLLIMIIDHARPTTSRVRDEAHTLTVEEVVAMARPRLYGYVL